MSDNKLKIFLDDERPCPLGWILAETVQEMRNWICFEGDRIEVVSLDNDLGMNQEEGKEFLNWLEARTFHDESFVPPLIHIHTANSQAGDQMEKARKSIQRILNKRGIKKNIIGKRGVGNYGVYHF